MDTLFSEKVPDYGIWFNANRAFTYSMSLLFPGVLGKRVHKKVNIREISQKDKWSYMLYVLFSLLLIPYFFFGIFLDFQKN